MSKLPGLSSAQAVRALRKAGFVYAPKRGKGSHVALYRTIAGKTRLVIVPKRKDLPLGTLRAIIEQSGLTQAEFLDLL
jgi:predicted RNA binding protein YcfA (HicA-like mRNA interferase family)